MQYFTMVSGALFVPYLVVQKCRQATTTTGVGATYNYLTQAAPAQAAITTTSFQQAIAVGGATPEAASAAPHQGECNDLAKSEVVSPTAGQREVVSPAAVQFMGKKIVV